MKPIGRTDFDPHKLIDGPGRDPWGHVKPSVKNPPPPVRARQIIEDQQVQKVLEGIRHRRQERRARVEAFAWTVVVVLVLGGATFVIASLIGGH